VPDTPDVAELVHALLRERSPVARARPDLHDDLPLGAGGLGLDSIALVELLLDCEQRLGIGPHPALLEGPPLTVGRLVASLASRVAP